MKSKFGASEDGTGKQKVVVNENSYAADWEEVTELMEEVCDSSCTLLRLCNQLKHVEVLTHVAQVSKSLCKIVTRDRMQGTGALYALPTSDGHDVHTFMTCNHVISSTDAEELSSMSLEFRVKTLGTIYFPRHWVIEYNLFSFAL